MNLEGNELHKITVNLKDRLLEDPLSIDIGSLLELVKIPDLGGVLNSFSNLLPQALTTLTEEGIYTLLDPTNLQRVVQEGINSVTGIIENEITAKLQQLMSLTSEVTNTAQAAAQSIVSAGASLASFNLGYLNKTAEQFLQSFNITGTDLTSIANVQSAASSIISTLDNLSPAEIRELANPAFYQQVFSQTLESAKNAVGIEAINNALTQISPSLNIITMNKLAETGVGLFNTGTDENGARKQYEILAEVRVFYAMGDGADSDAAQKKSVSGQALQSGVSCGVDNQKILIGSTVETSLGTFKAIDKTKQSVSAGLVPVHLFFENVEEAAMKTYELSSTKKNRQIVKVTPPGGTYIPRDIERRGKDFDIY